MKKKIIAIILSIATLLSIIPFANAIANTGESSQPEYVNYGAVIGNTAQFNIEKTVNFLVFENPETFDYELDWDNDENWLYFDSFDSSTDFEADQLFVIENYYYDDETCEVHSGALLMKAGLNLKNSPCSDGSSFVIHLKAVDKK